MDFTALVDVGIGLTVIYLGASLFATVINEYIAHILNLRGQRLAQSLQELITEAAVREHLRRIPALGPFFLDKRAAKRGAPASYVDAAFLATQLAGAVAAVQSPGATGQGSAAQGDLGTAIESLPDGPLKPQLRALWGLSNRAPEVFVMHLSTWLEKSLTAMGEVYKKHMQWISLGVGLVIAISLNLDTLRITQHLWEDKESRAALALVGAEAAGALTKEMVERCPARIAGSAGADTTGVRPLECAVVEELMAVVTRDPASVAGLPIGWGGGARFSPLSLVGWFLTALSLTLGASFWFDALKRLVNVRHGMRRPEAA